MTLAGLVVGMGKLEVHREFLKGYLKVGSYLEDVVINGRIILKWAVKKSAWLGVIWIDLSQNRDRNSGLL
jgi:hypothetical protein